MATDLLCHECRQPIPPDAPRSVCPACLFRLALDATGAFDDDGATVALVTPDGRESVTLAPTVATAPVPRALVPGYEILSELGRGGMGVVYKARHLALNRVVALKMILSAADAGPAGAARFRHEAEAAARLQHPNIVQVFEVGEHAGRPYVAMEYVEGG